ncbi:MAG: hypothetical protein Q8M83_02720 [bacterium]|nr:hypothetical protein [bacterium]
MDIKISKEKIGDPEKFIRRCGYGKIFDRHSGHTSYVRRASGDFYPRFHVYINDGGENWIFSLHLDQKKAIYEGVSAHSGEYDGKLVEQEGKRIESFEL